MKEYKKCYQVFLSQKWLRLILYRVYPILPILLSIWILSRGPLHNILLLFFFSSIILEVEIFLDYFAFGGIASKETNRLEYLKTSVRGMPTLQKALVFDGLRRLGCITIIMLCGYLAFAESFAITRLLGVILTPFMYVEAGLWVSRHFTTLTAAILVTCVISLIQPATIALCFLPGPWGLIIDIVLLLTSGFVAIASRIYIMKKARNSYYDEPIDKSNEIA